MIKILAVCSLFNRKYQSANSFTVSRVTGWCGNNAAAFCFKLHITSWPAVRSNADCNYFSQWEPSHVKPPLHSCVPIRSLQNTVRGTPFTTSVTLVNRFHSRCEQKRMRVCTSLQIILPEKLLGRESSFIQSNWNQNILWCESIFSRLPLFFVNRKQ